MIPSPDTVATFALHAACGALAIAFALLLLHALFRGGDGGGRPA